MLESVEIVACRAKNKYAWFGMTRLPQAIERLRTATLAKLNTEPAERQAAEAELGARTVSQGSRNTESDKTEGVDKETPNPSSHDAVGHSTVLESGKENSLGVLSQKFVQLFLNSEHGVVSLEPAARKLMEEDTFSNESLLKTKIRRLYDIANILCSLNLVLLFLCVFISQLTFFFAD